MSWGCTIRMPISDRCTTCRNATTCKQAIKTGQPVHCENERKPIKHWEIDEDAWLDKLRAQPMTVREFVVALGVSLEDLGRVANWLNRRVANGTLVVVGHKCTRHNNRTRILGVPPRSDGATPGTHQHSQDHETVGSRVAPPLDGGTG